MTFRSWLLGALLLVLADARVVAQAEQVRIVPTASWVSIYFEAIDALTRRVKLKPLRTLRLPPGDLEIRIWEGFGLGPLRGFIIRRTGTKWSALAPTEWPDRRAKLAAVPRSTDWARTWDELERGGLLQLRDDSEIPQCEMVLDGIGYVVEIARGGYYRTFLVDNPQSLRSEDGDRFLRLLPALISAFGGKPADVGSQLPAGQLEIVGTISSDPPGALPVEPSEWQSSTGLMPQRAADIQWRADEAIAAAVNLTTPPCRDLPSSVNRLHVPGDVVVEVRIEPDGTVSAARALAGPPLLREPSVKSALEWTFSPMASGNATRGATLTVRYREGWVRFPWIK